MSKAKDNKIVMSVRIDPKLAQQLDDLVERAGVSKGEFVERCLYVGLEDQKEYIESLEHPLVGGLCQALTNRKVLEAMLAITGSKMKVDEVQMQIRDNIRRKKQIKINPKPAVYSE